MQGDDCELFAASQRKRTRQVPSKQGCRLTIVFPASSAALLPLPIATAPVSGAARWTTRKLPNTAADAYCTSVNSGMTLLAFALADLLCDDGDEGPAAVGEADSATALRLAEPEAGMRADADCC